MLIRKWAKPSFCVSSSKLNTLVFYFMSGAIFIVWIVAGIAARYTALLAVLLLTVFATNSHAQSFCFLSASTYYEQIYCELQAKGETRGLPPFHQFKRNDETIQAVLLKRPAARARITLALPKKPNLASTAQSDKAAVTSRDTALQPTLPKQLHLETPASTHNNVSASPNQNTGLAEYNLAACELNKTVIDCGVKQFYLIANQANHRLAKDALTDTNTMSLPSYAGTLEDTSSVNRYLAQAYRQYVEKMHAIGLAGATMTYGKFVFLFYDLQEKQLDFSQRFEIMYGFLKQDKRTMAVSERVVVNAELQLSDCDYLSDDFLVCAHAGRNFLYAFKSEEH